MHQQAHVDLAGGPFLERHADRSVQANALGAGDRIVEREPHERVNEDVDARGLPVGSTMRADTASSSASRSSAGARPEPTPTSWMGNSVPTTAAVASARWQVAPKPFHAPGHRLASADRELRSRGLPVRVARLDLFRDEDGRHLLDEEGIARGEAVHDLRELRRARDAELALEQELDVVGRDSGERDALAARLARQITDEPGCRRAGAERDVPRRSQEEHPGGAQLAREKVEENQRRFVRRVKVVDDEDEGLPLRAALKEQRRRLEHAKARLVGRDRGGVGGGRGLQLLARLRQQLDQIEGSRAERPDERRVGEGPERAQDLNEGPKYGCAVPFVTVTLQHSCAAAGGDARYLRGEATLADARFTEEKDGAGFPLQRLLKDPIDQRERRFATEQAAFARRVAGRSGDGPRGRLRVRPRLAEGLHVPHEAVATRARGVDDALLCRVVVQQLAQVGDAVREGRPADVPGPVPVEELATKHDPIAMAQEVNQDLEGLGLDRARRRRCGGAGSDLRPARNRRKRKSRPNVRPMRPSRQGPGPIQAKPLNFARGPPWSQPRDPRQKRMGRGRSPESCTGTWQGQRLQRRACPLLRPRRWAAGSFLRLRCLDRSTR